MSDKPVSVGPSSTSGAPAIIIDTVIYPRKTGKEWREEHKLETEQITKAVLCSCCVSPITLHDELKCVHCNPGDGAPLALSVSSSTKQPVTIVEDGKVCEVYTFSARGLCTSSRGHLKSDLALKISFSSQVFYSPTFKILSRPAKKLKPRAKPSSGDMSSCSSCSSSVNSSPADTPFGSPATVTSSPLDRLNSKTPDSCMPVTVRHLISSLPLPLGTVQGFLLNQMMRDFAQYHTSMGITGQKACLMQQTFDNETATSIAHILMITVFASLKYAEASTAVLADYLSNRKMNWLNKNLLANSWVTCAGTFTNWR